MFLKEVDSIVNLITQFTLKFGDRANKRQKIKSLISDKTLR